MMRRSRGQRLLPRPLPAPAEPRFANVNFNGQHFEFEASVIIPVKNRVKTIGDAVHSVLKQRTSFPFNVIVVIT